MLSQRSEYRRGKLADRVKIADYLNTEFHGGASVRSPHAVTNVLSDYRRSLRERGSRRGDGKRRVPWVPAKEVRDPYPFFRFSEKYVAFMLSQRSEYRRGKRSDIVKIADCLNTEFHGGVLVRSPIAVANVLFDYRRGLGMGEGQRVPWVPAKEVRDPYPFFRFSEKYVAFMLSQRSEYRRGKLADNVKIANYLNTEFHGGASVRSPNAVGNVLYQSLRERGLGIGERQRVLWVSAKEVRYPYPFFRFSEKYVAFMLSQQSEYRRGKYADRIKIADCLNTEFHGGVSVRSPIAVASVLSDYRWSLRERGLGMGEWQRVA